LIQANHLDFQFFLITKKIQGDEGAKRVNVNLKNVTGDRFRHEKTKKKRSFKSGAKITLGVHSKTLDSSDDD